MRFIMFVRADEQNEAGILPDKKLFADMAAYNDKLAKE